MIYILGIERSATTWTANILDHHPQLDVYMEPLSDFNARFKDWPNRFSKLQNPEERTHEFRKEFEILKRHRRLFLTRLTDSPQTWRSDLKLAQLLARKKLAPGFVKDFLETNFHRKGRTISLTKQEPAQIVIKELRLNFNASLIPLIDNKPKVVVLIRDMASNVRSVMTYMDQGYLTELKSDLEKHYGKIDPKILCTYWIESYNELITTLQHHKIPYKITSHTDLLEKPGEATKKIFHFLNLPVAETVSKYLEISDDSSRGVHSTNRNRENLLKQIKKDQNYIYPLVEEELKKIKQHPFLKQYIRHSEK